MCICASQNSVTLVQNQTSNALECAMNPKSPFVGEPSDDLAQKLVNRVLPNQDDSLTREQIDCLSQREWKAIAVHTGSGFSNTLQKILHLVLHIFTFTLCKTISQQANSGMEKLIKSADSHHLNTLKDMLIEAFPNDDTSAVPQQVEAIFMDGCERIVDAWNSIQNFSSSTALDALKVQRELAENVPNNIAHFKEKDIKRAREACKDMCKLVKAEGAIPIDNVGKVKFYKKVEAILTETFERVIEIGVNARLSDVPPAQRAQVRHQATVTFKSELNFDAMIQRVCDAIVNDVA